MQCTLNERESEWERNLGAFWYLFTIPGNHSVSEGMNVVREFQMISSNARKHRLEFL